jgi:hypothetical protein
MTLTPHFVCGYQLQLLDISRKLHMLHLEYASLRQNDDSFVNWFEQFQKCSTELTDWVPSLPSCLQLNLQDDCTLAAASALVMPPIVMLHLYYHALVIYTHCLLSDPPYETLLSQPFDDTRAESQACCDYNVGIFVDIAARWIAKSGERFGWPVAWSVWIAARYLLVKEFRGRSVPAEKFSILLDCLRKMSRYWQISGKYWRLLKQAAMELHTGNAHSEQGTLQLLADFRVATSDLEDKFRVDPMLRYEATGENPDSFSDHVSVPDGHGPQQNLLDNNYFNLPDQTSDNWFHVPLFASSAYQQVYDDVSL